MLSTPSSKDRFDFSGRKELYTAYIPWAVAFGCADEWAEKYRIEVGEEPPGAGATSPGLRRRAPAAMVGSMVGDFDSTVEQRDLLLRSHRRARRRAVAGAAASPAAAVAAAAVAAPGDRSPHVHRPGSDSDPEQEDST